MNMPPCCSACEAKGGIFSADSIFQTLLCPVKTQAVAAHYLKQHVDQVLSLPRYG